MARSSFIDYGTALNLAVANSVTVSGTTPTVTSGITIAFWINPLSTIAAGAATQRIVRTTDDNIDLFFRASGPNLESKMTTTQGNGIRNFITQSNIPPLTWSFVMLTYDTTSGNIVSYVNNNLITTTARDSTNLICNNTWVVGDPGGGVAAKLDEVRVYNFAFNSAQRLAAYSANTWPTTGAVFAYKFDEGSGTTAIDASGNGKNGTITGATYVRHNSRVPVTGTRHPAIRFPGAISSSPDIDSHNGVTTDANTTYYYGLDTPAIRKFDPSWNKVLENNTAAADAGIQHIGDGQYYNGFLYCAAENYSSPVSYGSQRIAIFRASDLSFVEQHDVSAEGNEVSGLTIDPVAGIIYICSYVQSNKVFKYSLTDFSYLGYIQLTRDLTLTQGITYRDGFLYIATDGTKEVIKIDMNGRILEGFRVQTSTGGGQEGVDFTGKNMLVLDENSGTGQSIVRICPPVSARRGLNDNLVYNGNFELAPAFTGATNTDNRWIDGTVAGTANGDSYFGWATNNGAFTSSASYDSAVSHSGAYSMKISTVVAGQSMEVAPYRDDTNEHHVKYGIPVTPNTSYTFTYWMKTNYISGDSADGAFMSIRQFNSVGVGITTNNHTKVKTTTDWTLYTLTFTTPNTVVCVTPRMQITGNTGSANLQLDAWWDDLILKATTPIVRTAA